MTKGIIQKVFERYKQRIPYWQQSTFELLEQELIKEIRKECKWMQYPNIESSQHYAITAHKLLGDYPMSGSKE